MGQLALFAGLLGNAAGHAFLFVVLPPLGRRMGFADLQTGVLLSLGALASRGHGAVRRWGAVQAWGEAGESRAARAEWVTQGERGLRRV